MAKKSLIIAHRGFSGSYPENTLLAFRKAQVLGVDGFEMDIQLTRDKKVIVFHDETLERTTTGRGPVASLTLAELRLLDAGRGEKIPLLGEVLQAFPNGPQLYLELKYHHDNGYKPLVDAALAVLKKHKMKYRPVFCSFNWPALAYLRRRDENIGIAVLHLAKPQAAVIKCGLKVRASLLFTNLEEISAHKVERAHKNNLGVFVWTVNTKDSAAICRQAGADGLISNYPDLVRT
jgi:glycerophosphoryl diester phosphodiesterase